MPTKIQIRRGTATQWTTANPTLSSGEFGLETNTGKVKLGDGVTAWTSLAYFGNLEALDNVGDVIITSATTGQVLRFNGTNWVNATLTISDVSSFEITSPANGQTLQYNGTKWVNAAAASGETIHPFLLMGA
jgi:hypothetical protein